MTAVELLERIDRSDAVSPGEVARLAAEVLSDPPPLMAAAQRYLRTVGTEHEAAAAVEFLALLAVDTRAAACTNELASSGE